MSKDDLLQIPGTVTELLAGGHFRIKGDNGKEFVARISGRLRRFASRSFPATTSPSRCRPTTRHTV